MPPLEQVPSFMGRVAVSPSPKITTSDNGICGYATFCEIKDYDIFKDHETRLSWIIWLVLYT